jgi:DNA-binding MarR family transcriptional regulator
LFVANRTRAELLDDVMAAGREIGAAAVFFHSAVAARFGFGATDVKTMDILQRSGPLTPKQLGEQTGLAPASVTGIIDRLESKGFVRRTPHPDDGRRVLVEFDPAAYPIMMPMYEGLSATMHEMLAKYTTRELALINEVYREAARRQLEAALQIAADNPT